LHDCGRGRDHFSQGCQIKDGIDRHGSARGLKRALAEGLAVNDLIVVTDQENRAWDFIFLNRSLEDGIQGIETGRTLLGSRALTTRYDEQEEADDKNGRRPFGNSLNLQHRADERSSLKRSGARSATAVMAVKLYHKSLPLFQ
jgi:hypothetical protein